MRKRSIGIMLCMVFFVMGLVSCKSAAVRKENSVETDKLSSGQSAQPSQASASEAGKKKEGPMLSDQWQLAPGYGICERGEPALYVMDPDASRVRTDEEGVSARLLSAVYQDHVLSVKIETEDHTVTLIPQEKAETAGREDSYFCIDSEEQVYGRSAFRDKVKREENEKREEKKRAGETGRETERIYGAGIPDSGFTFDRIRENSNYGNRDKDKYYILTVSEKIISGKRFSVDEPEGIYKLYLKGFEHPLEIAFKRAPSYDSLDDVAGIVSHEGFYGWAQGSVEEKGLRLRTSTYSRDGYRIGFRRGRLMYTLSDGKTVEAIPVPGIAFSPEIEELSGIQPKSSQETMYNIPEGSLVKEASLYAERPVIISPEIADVIEIPIPEESGPMDEVIEFRDCRISMRGIKRLDELYEYGTNPDGGPIMKHMAYIDVSVEIKDEDKNLYYVSCIQPEADASDIPENSFSRVYAIPDIKGADPENTGELVGIKALYDEGDSVIRLQLSNPGYWWNQEFVLPVQM